MLAEMVDAYTTNMKRMKAEVDMFTKDLANFANHRKLLTKEEREREMLNGEAVSHPTPLALKKAGELAMDQSDRKGKYFRASSSSPKKHNTWIS